MRQRTWIIFRVGWYFGERDVAGRANEFIKLPIGDRRRVDPKTIDDDAMNGRFFRIMFIRSHAKRATRNKDHARQRRIPIFRKYAVRLMKRFGH